jgi:exosortase/archaeosortase family protein
VPIAILANIVRVMTLVLITYYLGDEAGQGFMHMASGMVIFIVAMGAMFAFDALLGRIVFRSATEGGRERS